MGHAYEGISADIISRYHNMRSEEGCFFVTGSDEHGQKIAGVAQEKGQEPIDLCDHYVGGFKVLNQRSLVGEDDYVRTTSERHKMNCQELWRKCAEAGDIYLGDYEGWYNVREELFVPEAEAAKTNYIDVVSGKELKKVKETSYFFRMSKYQERLVSYIQANPSFIEPEGCRNNLLQRLGEPLRDLSISRTTFSWGVPVPDGFEKDHVMYVWFDALTNYLTGVDGLAVEGADPNLTSLWPADCHIIGKDIMWFHCVIWPCMLMSAGIPLPVSVFCHGFINDKEGKKMSKTLKNTIDPHEMIDKYGADAFRWYLSKECPFGSDMSFNEANLEIMYNSDLCDTLGNLMHRATNLCLKYCAGKVTPVELTEKPPVDIVRLRDEVDEMMKKLQLDAVASAVMAAFRDINKYLADSAPWKLKGDEHQPAREAIIKTVLECVYSCSHFLIPFIPLGAKAIFEKLSTPPKLLHDLNNDMNDLKEGTVISIGEMLYKRPDLNDAKAREEVSVLCILCLCRCAR